MLHGCLSECMNPSQALPSTLLGLRCSQRRTPHFHLELSPHSHGALHSSLVRTRIFPKQSRHSSPVEFLQQIPVAVVQFSNASCFSFFSIRSHCFLSSLLFCFVSFHLSISTVFVPCLVQLQLSPLVS